MDFAKVTEIKTIKTVDCADFDDRVNQFLKDGWVIGSLKHECAKGEIFHIATLGKPPNWHKPGEKYKGYEEFSGPCEGRNEPPGQ